MYIDRPDDENIIEKAIDNNLHKKTIINPYVEYYTNNFILDSTFNFPVRIILNNKLFTKFNNNNNNKLFCHLLKIKNLFLQPDFIDYIDKIEDIKPPIKKYNYNFEIEANEIL
jgi:hypothetical protein